MHFAVRRGCGGEDENQSTDVASLAPRSAATAAANASTSYPNYYAAYLRDPDGRLVEFTCHEAE